ncbi:MAG: hypothetical protein DSZ03_00165, partial [Sulfurimonas sp.]
MLLPEIKEREAQFKLAIRMGFPIFLLSSVLLFSLLSQYLDVIPSSFIIIVVGLFAVAVYFLFYLIYKGYDERITDPITHVFTREYGMALFKKEIQQEPTYTFILISIHNLHDINEQYGINNGDIVLYETAQWIGRFFEEKGVKNFPICVLKGGDYLIGLKGDKNRYKTMSLATDEFIRRFLIHVLPHGFHRIRHYGLFANGQRAENLVKARKLLGVKTPQDPNDNDDTDDTAAPDWLLCPACGATMRIIEIF